MVIGLSLFQGMLLQIVVLCLPSQVYTVTDSKVVRTSASTSRKPQLHSSSGSLSRRPLQSAGGSITLKTPSSGPLGPSGPADEAHPMPAGEAAEARPATASASGSSPEAALAGPTDSGAAEETSVGEGGSRHGGRHVQFTEGTLGENKLGAATHKALQEDEDPAGEGLIRAHRTPGSSFTTAAGSAASSPADSFTTAASSLPSLSSLKVKPGRSSLVSQGSGSFASPLSSRKSSLASPTAACGGGGGGPRKSSLSAAAAAGARRPAKMASSPGDRTGQGRAAAAVRRQGQEGEDGSGGEEEEEDTQVQQSAASWSPSHAPKGKAVPSAAHGPRLSMYLQMQAAYGGRAGAKAH